MEKPVRPDKTQTTRHSRVSASAQLLHWIASSAGRSHLLLAFRHRSHASWFMLSEPAILLGIWEWTSLDYCVCGEWHYGRPRRLKPQSPASPCFFEDCRLKGKKWMERTEGGYIWASWNTTETETNSRWHVMLDEEQVIQRTGRWQPTHWVRSESCNVSAVGCTQFESHFTGSRNKYVGSKTNCTLQVQSERRLFVQEKVHLSGLKGSGVRMKESMKIASLAVWEDMSVLFPWGLKHQANLRNSFRPAIYLPGLFALFLAFVERPIRIQSYDQNQLRKDSRILPHVVYLMKSANLWKPGAHGSNKFPTGFNTPTPGLQKSRSPRTWQTSSEKHTTRSPIQGEPLVEVDTFVIQKVPLEREAEQLEKRQTLDSVALLENQGEGA